MIKKMKRGIERHKRGLILGDEKSGYNPYPLISLGVSADNVWLPQHHNDVIFS